MCPPTACRWTFQGLARNELEGVDFYPPGCIASGMPGATQDEIKQARTLWPNQAQLSSTASRLHPWTAMACSPYSTEPE